MPFTNLSKWRTLRPTLDKAAAITDSVKPLYYKQKTNIDKPHILVRDDCRTELLQLMPLRHTKSIAKENCLVSLDKPICFISVYITQQGYNKLVTEIYFM